MKLDRRTLILAGGGAMMTQAAPSDRIVLGVIGSAIFGQRFSRQNGEFFLALTRRRGLGRTRGIGAGPRRKILGFGNSAAAAPWPIGRLL